MSKAKAKKAGVRKGAKKAAPRRKAAKKAAPRRKRAAAPGSVSFTPIRKAMDQLRKKIRAASGKRGIEDPRASEILTAFDDLDAAIRCDKTMTIPF